jgi:hypothetical protein
MEEHENGVLETPRQAIRRVAENSTLERAEVEIRKALSCGAGQVIYFTQDKVFLSELRKRLCELAYLGFNRENVQVLDSSVPGWKRKKLLEPERRDSTRVFLMTSSGARGVSFPRTDWIIAAMPRFNIEAALMEIAQLIYRGRGMFKDKAGQEVSGDNVPRRLVMLVEDFAVCDKPLDKRQWLRQSIDLMTLLVMLRATILTRITGLAGLNQPLALVPVGAVGVEELVSIMSANVTKFIQEAEVYCRRAKDEGRIGLVKSAQANVIELFSRTKLQATATKGSDGRTLVKPAELEILRNLVASAVSPLLIFGQTESLPAYVFFSGPIIIEDWREFSKQEVFAFEGHQTQMYRLNKYLLGQLRAIDADKDFSSQLRVPAINLYRLLNRDKHDAAKEFNTLKELKSPNTWVAIPSGYSQFLHNEDTCEGRPFFLVDPEIWLDVLAQSLSLTSSVMPPIARYQSFPWAAAVGQANPLKFDQVFDDRYFMASSELNLLNTLLLNDKTQHRCA